MKWFCFMFWFCYRLFMACLQHFNWCVAMYTNCAYFCLWKSYDLFWFWMHLGLCTCFPQLRRENYLLVWCNILKKQYTTYPNLTYKQIYLVLYGGRGTKAEVALENMENKERLEHEEQSSRRLRRRLTRDRMKKGLPVNPEDEVESSSSDDDTDSVLNGKSNGNGNMSKPRIPDVIHEENEEARKYALVGEAVEDSVSNLENLDTDTPLPPPRPSRLQDTSEAKPDETQDKPTFNLEAPKVDDVEAGTGETGTNETVAEDNGEESDTNSTSRWLDKVPAIPKAIRNRFRRVPSGSDATTKNVQESNGDSASTSPPPAARNADDNVSVSSAWTKFRGVISNVSMPKFNRSVSTDNEVAPVDILRPDFTNTYDLLDPKKAAKRAKRDRQALTKRIRRRIKEELKEAARRERKRRMITDAIELILQLLRMITSFAVLVGNIRKTFIPAQFKYLKTGQHHHDHPWLTILFRITTFMDVTMFSINFLWVYCLQWHLCCRLGLVRFWFWTGLLLAIAFGCMIYPMSIAMDQLDPSWCHFKQNASLFKYQPKWNY